MLSSNLSLNYSGLKLECCTLEQFLCKSNFSGGEKGACDAFETNWALKWAPTWLKYVSIPSVPFTLLTFKGHNKGKGTEAYMGQVGPHFKALIFSKIAACSVFTASQVAIGTKTVPTCSILILAQNNSMLSCCSTSKHISRPLLESIHLVYSQLYLYYVPYLKYICVPLKLERKGSINSFQTCQQMLQIWLEMNIDL